MTGSQGVALGIFVGGLLGMLLLYLAAGEDGRRDFIGVFGLGGGLWMFLVGPILACVGFAIVESA